MRTTQLSFFQDATPGQLLFYLAVPILLLSVIISGLGFISNSPTFFISGSALLIIWFIMIFTAVLPQTNRVLGKQIDQIKKATGIIFISLLILGLIDAAVIILLIPNLIQNHNVSNDFRQLLMQVEDGYRYNDASALSHQAVENLLHGQNPYAHANIIQALLEYNGNYTRVTPLRLGVLSKVFPAPQDSQLKQVWDKAIQNPSQVPPELESRVCYPAGSFLLPVPFVYLGISDIRITYAIFFLDGLAYAIWVIPKKKRLIFIGIVLISLELWNSLGDGGELGSLCFPLLAVGWLALNRNLWLSTICMGLAVSTKQTAWFFVPFYLILLFKTQGSRKLLTGMAVIAGIFIITNLPFIIADPRLWFNSVTSPMTDPMFPLGNGLITIVSSGLFNIQSSLPFAILEGIAFIVVILWYLRYCRRYPQTGIILAVIPLFFAWRSMFSYFFYVDIILLAYILVNDNSNRQTITLDVNPSYYEQVS